MIFCTILFFLIPVADLIVLKFAQKPSYTLYTHLCLTLLGAYYYVYFYHAVLTEKIHSVRLLLVVVCVICGIVIYITDLMLKNMILHDVLILDWRYYFSPKKGMHIYVLLSLLIACGEELVFRLPICVFPVDKLVLLLLSSVTYGIVHLFFSRYDACSKIVLGLLLAICVMWTKSIYVSFIIHSVYNIASCSCGGLEIFRKVHK